MDTSILVGTIKAWNHGSVDFAEDVPQTNHRCISVIDSVTGEHNHIRCVDELIAEKLCEEQTIEVLPATSNMTFRSTLDDLSTNLFEGGFQILLKSQTCVDIAIPVCHQGEHFPEIDVVFCELVAHVQQICHLVVILAALTRSRWNNVSSRFVARDNLLGSREVLSVRHGRPTKLCDNYA